MEDLENQEPVEQTTEENTSEESKEQTQEQPEQKQEQNIPYSRFKEVNDELKSYKQKLSELESKFTQFTKPKEQETPKERKAREYFLKKGYDEVSADALGDSVEEYLNERIKPIQSKLDKYDVAEQLSQKVKKFSEIHTDFKEVEGKMTEIYNNLSPEMQYAIAKDENGLDFLYSKVKSVSADDKFKEGYESAYKKKQEKLEAGNLKGNKTGKSNRLSWKEINDMTSEEYEKRQDEIEKSWRNGEIEEE